jgi:fructose transport system ATP-binding protein
VDQEGEGMTTTPSDFAAHNLSEEEQHTVGLGAPPVLADPANTVLSARGLHKTFGKVIGIDGVDVDQFPGEVLSVIGDNGAGKSTLIKALTGALIPDAGHVYLDGQEVHFKGPQDSRQAGIETVYQTLAVAPALDIAANMYLGRERRRPGPLGTIFRMLDKKGMKEDAGKSMANLGIATVQNMGQAVETLSGGQRQAVAVARAATFATKFVVLDEPTAALGVKETGQVLNLIRQIKEKGMPVILISHNMPNVFEVSDRIHIARLGGCAGVITPKSHTPTEAVAIMTGATTLTKG